MKAAHQESKQNGRLDRKAFQKRQLLAMEPLEQKIYELLIADFPQAYQVLSMGANDPKIEVSHYPIPYCQASPAQNPHDQNLISVKDIQGAAPEESLARRRKALVHALVHSTAEQRKKMIEAAVEAARAEAEEKAKATNDEGTFD